MTDSRHIPVLPDIPQSWKVVLGKPLWRLEWMDNEGRKQTMTIRGNEVPAISLPQTWTSAVSALPYWPARGIEPGLFKPAGAIFPFDVSGKHLILSWQGGIDATLFRELGRAYRPETETPDRAVSRLPWNFNWPRFRQLFNDPAQSVSLNGEILADPWLADWQGIAAKIIQSGFDKRRLVPEPRTTLEAPAGPGPWIGTSPFAAPLLFEAMPVFPVRAAAATWVSPEGILRCNTETWIFIAK